MHYPKIATVGTFVLTLVAGACSRDVDESREPATRAEPNRAAELQQKRNDDISQLDKRVLEIERDYTKANQKVVSGERTATAGLREELKEDVTNVKNAVGDLRTTTPENWWDRHERAMKRTADDVEADVQRLAGTTTPKQPPATSNTTGEAVSTEPFTSRRDHFVNELRARVDAMERALDDVKVHGTAETEVQDVRARVKKLGDDVDRLRSASADDWWDVTKARVSEYVDRVERSIKRLDDNKG